MRTIRKISKNPAFSAILLLSFSLFSCGKETLLIDKMEMSGKEMMRGIFFIDGPASDYITPLSELKLEQLFGYNTEHLQLVRTNIDRLLDHIEKESPGSFASFKRDITSGDHIVISETLSKYASILNKATIDVFSENHLLYEATKDMRQPLAELIDSYFPNDKRNNLTPQEVKEVITSDDFKMGVSNYFKNLDQRIDEIGNSERQMGFLIVIVAAVAVLVIYVVGILAYAYAYAWEGYDWGPIPENAKAKSLLKEQVIEAIALNFNKFK